MGEVERGEVNAVKEEEVDREGERGKEREKEDRGRKVIRWLEVRAMKKEEKEERGERRKTEREKSLDGWK